MRLPRPRIVARQPYESRKGSMNLNRVSHPALSAVRPWTRFCRTTPVLLVVAVHPLWSQSAVWQPQGATTGNIYYNGGNVGIGSNVPASKLDVTGGNLRLSRPGDNFGYVFQNAGGGISLNIGYMTNNDSAWFTGLPILTMLYTGNVGIGTTNPQYKLAVEGAIGARDIIVTNTPWSDYVFRPGYRLRPLSEVASYISKHGHLPEIPSEAEVKEKGVSVADVQAKLLAKIEELTLHLIQQEKDNRELRDRLTRLETQAGPCRSPASVQ